MYISQNDNSTQDVHLNEFYHAARFDNDAQAHAQPINNYISAAASFSKTSYFVLRAAVRTRDSQPRKWSKNRSHVGQIMASNPSHFKNELMPLLMR